MARKGLGHLSTTGRKYLDGTHRARLASPGIEHYPGDKGGGAIRTVAVAVALVAALVGAMFWFWGSR
jgi:hypothetical protein